MIPKQTLLNSVARVGLAAALVLGVAGCGEADVAKTNADAAPAAQTANAEQTESQRLFAFLEEVYERILEGSPQTRTFEGDKTDYDKWDDRGEEKQKADLDQALGQLDQMHAEIDFAKLDDQSKVSYRLFEAFVAQRKDGYKYRHHGYPVNQMGGVQSNVPSFLINFHRIDTLSDAEAYIARLHGIKGVFGQVIDDLKVRQEMGVMPPKFVFPKVIANIKKTITGKPFDDSQEDNVLLADFKKKVGGLEIEEAEKTRLTQAARTALLESVGPAFTGLLALLEAQEKVATTDDGVWKLPDGDNYYANQLGFWTTTDMTGAEIHELGLREIDRIHDEIRGLMKTTDFDGDLKAFFKFMREDEQFYYPNSDEGRERYLKDLNGYVDEVKGKLEAWFGIKPKADMTVKRVEKFREASAPGAFYYPPAMDGSRPGTYYVNLYDMKNNATWDMVTTAYHEGIPGHHMQGSITSELEGQPRMAKSIYFFGAYVEGWALYAEFLAKEMGLYEGRPYPDFGRLSWELWRAGRLVTDSGIHFKHWTRQQAIDYLLDNTPQPKGTVISEVERYIVLPGQATSYKIGMLKIQALRAKARTELGGAFNIRAFHDVVLSSGAVPLDILEQNVTAWIARTKS